MHIATHRYSCVDGTYNFMCSYCKIGGGTRDADKRDDNHEIGSESADLGGKVPEGISHTHTHTHTHMDIHVHAHPLLIVICIQSLLYQEIRLKIDNVVVWRAEEVMILPMTTLKTHSILGTLETVILETLEIYQTLEI